jgi:hypothetical protein
MCRPTKTGQAQSDRFIETTRVVERNEDKADIKRRMGQ